MRTKYILVFPITVILLMAASCLEASSAIAENSLLPFRESLYGNQHIVGLWNILKHRVAVEPFNLVATIIFLLSIIHTFLANKFTNLAKHYDKIHEARMLNDRGYASIEDRVSYKAEIFYILGEIELVFALWLLPLLVVIYGFFGWEEVISYLNKVNYIEAVFVVVIMAIASTRPIVYVAEIALKQVASLGNCSPAAWWFSILTIGPLLGSLITEPAAMTISAVLLVHQFYHLTPSSRLAYATLGLLFVNISIGGTFTHFAAPSVLMVASTWGWDTKFMLIHFGWKVLIAILMSNILYFILFRKEFGQMKKKLELEAATRRQFVKDSEIPIQKIPIMIIILHICFLAWTVFNLHSIPLVFGGFMVFLAFTQVTFLHQYQFAIRGPLLVGLFLAGLVTHGTLQQWWIEPILGQLTEIPLFIGATVLAAFNDNALITFLASLVPSFADNITLQKAVVYGAVAGGGLTVIANAPNPAGQSILSKFFPEGVSPKNLFIAAIIPTIIVSLIFMVFP